MGNLEILSELSEIVDTKHTVLVVWHPQNHMVNTSFNKKEFLNKTKSFIEIARDNNIPIVYAKTTPYPKNYESSWKIFMHMQETRVDDPLEIPSIFADSKSQASQICCELSPQENDVVLSTYTSSIFIGTSFENLIRNRGIKTILFTGIATEMGIASCARDSRNRGFYTIVVQDCVSSREEEYHKAALKVLSRVCIVIPSRDITKEWIGKICDAGSHV